MSSAATEPREIAPDVSSRRRRDLERDLLKPDEAARRLNVSVGNLMQHVRDGRLSFVDIGTGVRRRYRFRPHHIESFLERREGRECPSTSDLKAHSITTSSNSTVVAFSALPRPQKRKTLR